MYQYVEPDPSNKASLEPLKNTGSDMQCKVLNEFVTANWKIGDKRAAYFCENSNNNKITIKLRKLDNGVMKVKFTDDCQPEQPFKAFLLAPNDIDSVPLSNDRLGNFEIKEKPKPLRITIETANGTQSITFDDFFAEAPNVSSAWFLEFCQSTIGMEYLKHFTNQLKEKRPPAMPCAAELHEKMCARLDYFLKNENYHLNKEDINSVNEFKERLNKNRDNGYPYNDSLTLAYIFTYATSYLFLKYDNIGDEKHPTGFTDYSMIKILDAKNSFANYKEEVNSLLLREILSIPERYFSDIGSLQAFSTLEKDSFFFTLSKLRRSNSEATKKIWMNNPSIYNNDMLRLPIADDLGVSDFNKLAGIPISPLRVLMENYRFHDADFMSACDFMYYDRARKLMNDRNIDTFCMVRRDESQVTLERKVVSAVLRDASSSLSSSNLMNANQKKLFELMFFEFIYDDFAINKTTNEIAYKVKSGLKLGGKFYGLEKTPQADALARLWDEKDIVISLFEIFLEEIQNACIEQRLFNPEKAWLKSISHDNDGI